MGLYPFPILWSHKIRNQSWPELGIIADELVADAAPVGIPLFLQRVAYGEEAELLEVGLAVAVVGEGAGAGSVRYFGGVAEDVVGVLLSGGVRVGEADGGDEPGLLVVGVEGGDAARGRHGGEAVGGVSQRICDVALAAVLIVFVVARRLASYASVLGVREQHEQGGRILW